MEMSRKELEAQERLLENNLKISLLVEINEVLQQRQEVVQRHNLLLKNISDLQNQIESLWDAKVSEAKQQGAKLEADVSALRLQITALQKASGGSQPVKLSDLSPQDGPKSAGKELPSRKANYKITATRLQSDIKSLRHRINGTKLRLLNEIKNKQQAEAEVRQLRSNISSSKHNSKATTPLPGPVLCYFGDSAKIRPTITAGRRLVQ
ncbi:uncharacterized protein LOC128997812 isoform X2 [Macrosteles quadrilineatus]|uniref:uncharacterized protein LOC128997812 isoform X2 n=1 Tax=Macrosteles quadrilineatus TaxID=74068 RepID=UPI0023E0BE4E|nr:uncharacterized protein LOC128997812 isoform X2 [Macrosteles quadrilineatus]